MQNKVIPRNLLNWKNKNKNKTVKDNRYYRYYIYYQLFKMHIQKLL